jgi:hypothetical protein
MASQLEKGSMTQSQKLEGCFSKEFAGPSLHKTGYPWVYHLYSCHTDSMCRSGKTKTSVNKRLFRFSDREKFQRWLKATPWHLVPSTEPTHCMHCFSPDGHCPWHRQDAWKNDSSKFLVACCSRGFTISRVEGEPPTRWFVTKTTEE